MKKGKNKRRRHLMGGPIYQAQFDPKLFSKLTAHLRKKVSK